jgi:glycerophosphoryl diester phosphodiesterase
VTLTQKILLAAAIPLLCSAVSCVPPAPPAPPALPEWIYLSEGLIAHAGGGIDGHEGTNSLEAIQSNYGQGHRVFEIDLNLTTDGDLVCVHDWPSYSGPLSRADFLKRRIADKYTAISLRDVYELMLTYEDMYLVTDTKSFEYADEDTLTQFERLRSLAEEMDITLLNRVIPQIYNQNHYQMLKGVYDFSSVIYTLYASPDTDREVTDFVLGKPDIPVVTMGPVRYSPDFYKALTKAGKKIYFFTLNDLNEVRDSIALGAHGFYTDFITPEEMAE